jgi:hypothetical protein
MKRLLISTTLLAALTAVLLASNAAWGGSTTTVRSNLDSYVSEANPDQNYGSLEYMYVWAESGSLGDCRALVEFPLSSVPVDAVITFAELRFSTISWNASGRTYEFRRITGGWTEGGVTWNNQPAVTSTNGVDVSAPSGALYEVTVTGQVQDARAAGNWYGVRIKDSAEGSGDVMSKFMTCDDAGGVYPKLYVEYEQTPSITSASVTDMDDTDNLYAMRKYYSFEAVVNDGDGAGEISKVYLRGLTGTTARFEVRGGSLDSTPAWSIQTGADVIDLDETTCSWDTAGDEGTATFKVRLEWDFPQEEDLELAVYVEDVDGRSAGWTEKATNHWDAVTRLVTESFAPQDGRIDVAGSATLAGEVRYATTTTGNTASSHYPPDNQFAAVKIHDATHTAVAQDTSVTGGAFSASFNIPGAVDAYSYHVYLDMAGDYTDGDAPDGDTAAVIGDALNCTQQSVQLASSYTEDQVAVRMTYAYDSQPVSGGTIHLNGIGSRTTNTTGWATWNLSGVNELDYGPEAYGSADPTHGLTVTGQNQSVQVSRTMVDPFRITAKSQITDPSWSDTDRELFFTASDEAAVDCGEWGQPLRVDVDFEQWTDYTWHPDEKRVVVHNLASPVLLTWETSEGGDGGGVPPGGSGGVIPEFPVPVTPVTPAGPEGVPFLLVAGVGLIVVIVAGSMAYRGAEQKVKETWSDKRKKRKKW